MCFLKNYGFSLSIVTKITTTKYSGFQPFNYTKERFSFMVASGILLQYRTSGLYTMTESHKEVHVYVNQPYRRNGTISRVHLCNNHTFSTFQVHKRMVVIYSGIWHSATGPNIRPLYHAREPQRGIKQSALHAHSL